MLPNIVMGILLKLLTAATIEKVVLLALKQLAKLSESKADDELVEIVEKALTGKEPEAKPAK